MGTASMIGTIGNDGIITASYCHYDGYVEGVGKTLSEFYNSNDAARIVATGGYLSSLSDNYAASIRSAVNVEDPVKFNCAEDFISITRMTGTGEYVYLWNGSEWQVANIATGIFSFANVSSCLENN